MDGLIEGFVVNNLGEVEAIKFGSIDNGPAMAEGSPFLLESDL